MEAFKHTVQHTIPPPTHTHHRTQSSGGSRQRWRLIARTWYPCVRFCSCALVAGRNALTNSRRRSVSAASSAEEVPYWPDRVRAAI